MRRYGLIGKTLKHSFSKDFFTKKFEAEGLPDCTYENFELAAINDIEYLLQANPDIQGLNITIPYKEAVLPYLDHSNDVVASMHACNCIHIKKQQLYGYNTDVIGFEQSLLQHIKPHHTHALVLGTGGAAKAVQYALKELAIPFILVSRTAGEGIITYKEMNQHLLAQYTLIINTTPSGMYPNVADAPDIPYTYLTPHHFLYDLIYNPATTRFLQLGKDKGAQIANGYDMLVLQALESWRIWNS